MSKDAKHEQIQEDITKQKHKSKEKKTTITLSLDQQVINTLKDEANKEQTSLSSKVSKILLKHIVTYRFSHDIRSIFVSENTFKMIVDQVDENLLWEDFSTNALDFVPTLFYAKNIPFTIDNIIKYALIGAGLQGGIYNHFHHHKDSQGFTILVMRHNFGLKWSKILSKGLIKLINDTVGCKSSAIILSSSVTIKVLQMN